jgi:GNAT superfamily N-acetyltransferase
VVSSANQPDGARFELPADTARDAVGADAVCIADYGDERRVRALRVTPHAAPKAPPLWFVEARESSGAPPAVSLVAFTGHDVPAGSLRDDTGGTSATSADQVGAVRWYAATGEIDQIYVQPAWRRRTVATALIAAAATLSYARDWPRLWSDGQRTELGEHFRNSGEWRHRAADLTHLAPPMTPGDA